ncbi:hypothetical protein CUJ84_Chr005061 [Rhizobium leguminosarum]|uniref:Uncharacterized protein n=1 Tax=Rhizobium leguminosarum TaxID=384 RepID=A0A2K9ZAX7_RHILE|nr:hypothetical protein CUJ84_Chr005061 [Rhizobium leguminosarum]
MIQVPNPLHFNHVRESQGAPKK